MPPDTPAADAQAEKRAAEDRKRRRQAKRLILRLLAAVPEDADPGLEREAITWLHEDATQGNGR